MELHGGSVEVESDGERKGATFTVTLPALSGSAATSPAKSEESLKENLAAKSLLSGLKILLVEDEIDTRDLLIQLLSSCEAEVKAAESAYEAMELLTDWQPDILVSDISMPEVDGYSFIRQVRNGDRQAMVPAIALTAHARAEDRQIALAAGFQEHLSKPVSLHDLAQVIAKLVGRAEAGS